MKPSWFFVYLNTKYQKSKFLKKSEQLKKSKIKYLKFDYIEDEKSS